MDNNIQIFNNPEFGEIRIIGDADNPLFCLADVCKILAIGNPSDVRKRLDDGVVSIEVIVDSLGRQQTAAFITESGLYDVIFDSRKPEAKRFRKWVTDEVLPSIRKTGSYSVDKINPQSEIAAIEREKIALERDRLAFEQNKLAVEIERIALEREKLVFEREKFNVDNSEDTKNLAKAQLLRELASASGNNSELREELVLASAKGILGENFYNDDDLLPRLRRR